MKRPTTAPTSPRPRPAAPTLLHDLRLIKLSLATIGKEETIRVLRNRPREEVEAMIEAALATPYARRRTSPKK